MDRIFSSRAVLTVDENNNEVTTTRRSIPLKKILIPLLCLGFIGSIAATIGVAAAPGSRNHDAEWAPIMSMDPVSAGKLKRIRELAPQRPNHEILAPEEVCYDPACLDQALDLLTSMNTSVDPCVDFFDYACGRWNAEHPLDGSQGRTGRFNKLRDEVNNITQEILTSPVEDSDFLPLKQVKWFYKQCVDLAALNAAGTAPVVDVLNSLGGWPSQKADWNVNDFNLALTLGTIRRIYLESVLLRVYVSQDLKNTDRSVIYLDQPGFFLPRAVLVDAGSYEARIAAYKQYYTDVVGALNGNTTAAAEDVAKVTDLEIKLAGVSSADEYRGNVSRIYNLKNLTGYQGELDAVGATNPWAQINLKAILDEIFNSSGVTIGANEEIIVLELDYYTELIKILDATDARTVANYIHWRVASGLLPETTDQMRKLAFQFDKVNSGLAEPAKRETTCANAALNGFGMAIGTKYIEMVQFGDSAVDNLNELVENLRVSFKQLLNESAWMSDETKPNALAKADAIKSFMAYPEWIDNRTAVESQFTGLDVAADGSYLASVTELSHWMGDESLKSLRKPTDRDYWLTYPGVVNAFYSPEMNSITFPAGILQPPFYRIGGPNAINYGGIGVVIGHEITHGFDDQGSQYAANGNAENWWNEADLKQFEAKAQCIVDQYGAYTPLPGKHINGDLTSGENIADNGGLREAYRAYRNWVAKQGKEERRLPGLEDLTPDQLFFLGYASLWCENSTPQYLENQLNTDPHSPGRYRVWGPLINSAEFADKYQCPRGSAMNPDPAKRCVVW